MYWAASCPRTRTLQTTVNCIALCTFGDGYAQVEQLVIWNTGQGGWTSLAPLTFR